MRVERDPERSRKTCPYMASWTEKLELPQGVELGHVAGAVDAGSDHDRALGFDGGGERIGEGALGLDGDTVSAGVRGEVSRGGGSPEAARRSR